VTASGRILVPINFRLGRDEVEYIVGHSQASLLLVDPALALPLAGVRAPRRLTLGPESDAALLRFGVEPEPWDGIDENATATINYTSGTTARPKGVELTHRNIWLNATVMALHLGIGDHDVYLHTCRCSTRTVGACRSRSPRSACRRSSCGRSTDRRSCAASTPTA
jgi:long-subunit acyl-CoA synthetase (AMP-forming)